MASGKFSKPRVTNRPEITIEDVDFKQEVPQAPAAPPEAPVPRSNPVRLPHSPAEDETQPLSAVPPRPAAPSKQPMPKLAPQPEQDYIEEDEESSSAARRKKITLICVAAVAAVLVIGLIIGAVILLGGQKDDGRILDNVMVAGVNLGGMTKEQAENAIHLATDLTFALEDMVVQMPDKALTLSPAKTGAKLDVAAAVQAAYDYGRTGTKAENKQIRQNALSEVHHIALLPYLNLDTDYIQSVLNEYGDYYNTSFRQSSVKLEGEMPILDAADPKFDKDAECQTLVLDLGTPGRGIDIRQIYNDVLDCYSLNRFLVTVTDDGSEKVPEEFDLEELYELYASEPQDAQMDDETFEVTAEIYGYEFDLLKAEEMLAEAKYGDVVEIPFRLMAPEKLGEDLEKLLFRDVLGSYETATTGDVNRNTNLTLACKAIDGLVLNPGDTFDYNKVVGERTAAKGYKEAGAYVNGESVSTLGGGVCQVSSTIYYCALVADLEIVTRQAHSFVSSYMPMGLDATVSWGGPEFRFRNSTNYPIRIDAQVADGYVRIKLVGTDEKDYYVKMESKVLSQTNYNTVTQTMAKDNPKGYTDGQVIQTPYTGYTVKTYKLKYDKKTDALLSNKEEATSIYKSRDKIVVAIEQPTEPTTEPTTAPTTEPTTAPTTEPTTAPTTEPTTAPTTAPTEATQGGISEG